MLARHRNKENTEAGSERRDTKEDNSHGQDETATETKEERNLKRLETSRSSPDS